MEFVKRSVEEMRGLAQMKFTPIVLVQSKMDRDGVGTLLRSNLGQQLAQELGLGCYLEVSTDPEMVDLAIGSISKVVHEPRRALS